MVREGTERLLRARGIDLRSRALTADQLVAEYEAEPLFNRFTDMLIAGIQSDPSYGQGWLRMFGHFSLVREAVAIAEEVVETWED